MKLSNTEKMFIISKLHKEGWKDKDIKKHLEELNKNLNKVQKQVKSRKSKENSLKKTNEYFKNEFNKLFD